MLLAPRITAIVIITLTSGIGTNMTIWTATDKDLRKCFDNH